MAFSFSVKERGVFGDKRYVKGTYDCTGVTGGDISTGLQTCEQIFLQPTGTAVIANQHVCNETFPVSGGVITIVTNSGDKGLFIAFGL
jgi:hypothetical protein